MLVLGASGGVGSFAVQMSTGLRRPGDQRVPGDKTSAVRAFRRDEVVADRRRHHRRGDRELFDVIVDTGGRHPVGGGSDGSWPRGRLVIVGGEGGVTSPGASAAVSAPPLSPFVGQRLTVVPVEGGVRGPGASR